MARRSMSSIIFSMSSLILCSYFGLYKGDNSKCVASGGACTSAQTNGMYLLQRGIVRSQSHVLTSDLAESVEGAQGRLSNPEVQLHDMEDATGDVVVGDGQTVRVSKSMTVKSILVEKFGTLLFDDVENLELHAGSIEVKGTFKLGTAEQPLVKGTTITLTGDRGDEKGILIKQGGDFEAHGRPFSPTWTRLASTAMKGTNTVSLQENVDWIPGQKLLLVTTVFRDEEHNHQNEIVTIGSVSGKTVVLEETLRHNHYGGPEYFGEVALLSRSITIQGDEASEGSKYGGHTMCEVNSLCRVSYVRAHRMGQTNVMARYPFHFHMMGDVAGQSFFKGLSVERSYYRAFTIHGTSNAVISQCVAYDVIGSAVYLEDGSESFNLFEKNLIAHVHPIKGFKEFQYGTDIGTIDDKPDRIVPTDKVASCFYCTNPHNRWIGNIASGGQVGFIFPALPQVMGLSRESGIYNGMEPMKLDILEFNGNTAHSAGWWWNTGACSYFGGLLENPDPNDHTKKRYTPGRVNSVRGKAVMNGTTYYACRHALVIWGNIKVHRPHVHAVDNTVWDTMTGYRMLGHNMISGGVLGARSGNSDVFEEGENWELATNPWGAQKKRTDTGLVGMSLYDTAAQTMISGMTFKNFSGPYDMVFHQPAKYKEFVPQGLATFFKLEYEDTDFDHRLVLNRGKDCFSTCHTSQYASATDRDGTTSNVFGGALLGASDIDNPECERTCQTKDWWKLDDVCKKAFDRFGGTASGGWWACPKNSPNVWAQAERFVVSLVLVSGDTSSLKEKGSPGYTTDQGKHLMNAATKHSNFQDGTMPIPGVIYHFGTEPRQVEIGFDREAESVVVSGVCCDIGWFFVPTHTPQYMHIMMEQIDKDHGLVFAVPYPGDADLQVKRFYRFGNKQIEQEVEQTNNKTLFLSSPGTKFFLESTGSGSKLLFLNLVNEHGSRYRGYEPYADNWEVANAFEEQPRYFIEDKSGGGPVDDALAWRPAANWLAVA